MTRLRAVLLVLVALTGSGCGSVAASDDADADPTGADGSRADGVLAADAGPVAANYAFVTSDVYAVGTLGGVDAADVLCQDAADAGDARLHGRTYRAWISGPGASAIDRLGEANGWIRLDGMPVALRRQDLVAEATDSFPRLLYPPRLDQRGLDRGGVFYATGTDAAGRPAQSCGGWTTTDALVNGRWTDGGWRADGQDSQGCGVRAPLLCLGTDYGEPLEPLAVPPGARVVFASLDPTGVALGGGVSELDARCASEAATASLTGRFVALVATTTAAAASRVSPEGGPWYRTDGVRAIADPDAFLGGAVPDAPLGLTIEGSIATYASTGGSTIDAPGVAGETCGDWTQTGGVYSVGGADRSSAAYFDMGGRFACGNISTLYCLTP